MEPLGKGQIRLVSFPKTAECRLSRKVVTGLPGSAGWDEETWVPSEYHALSYCWGTERESILCDGTEVTVPSSLVRALACFERHFPDQLLWADSLSIDQEDLGEKSEQVGMMATIYRWAQRVVVYLGADTEDIYETLQNTELLQTSKNERIQFLQRISTVQWFYRAWTFQEIRLGRNAMVMLGEQIMPWDQFISTIRSVRELEPHFSTVQLRSTPQMYRRFAYIDQDRFFSVLGSLNLGTTYDLAGLLFLTWYRACAEKRDKIYSVLGLLASEQSKPDCQLSIDYKIRWSELCIKAARLCLNISQGSQEPLQPKLKVLRIAGMVERWKDQGTDKWNSGEASELFTHPSWAPNWWHPPQRTRSSESLVYDKRGIFDKLTFCCSDKLPVQALDDSSPFLVLKGVLLGFINVDEAPITPGGFPLIHAPPQCMNWSDSVVSSPKTGAEPQIHIPKVDMGFFAQHAHRHMVGDCSCIPFRPRDSFPNYGQPEGPTPNRFSQACSFPIFDFPRPKDTPEKDFPAQVLAASVESGDWLVLLEGGGLPFILRPLKSPHGQTTKTYELNFLADAKCKLPNTAGCFVLVGEASMCWDKLWPGQWGLYCRAGEFIIV